VLFIRYLEKQDKIWAKIFCIPKNMHSRTLMPANFAMSYFLFHVKLD